VHTPLVGARRWDQPCTPAPPLPRQAGSQRSGVDADAAEVVVEPWLHKGTRVGIERLPRRPQHVADDPGCGHLADRRARHLPLELVFLLALRTLPLERIARHPCHWRARRQRRLCHAHHPLCHLVRLLLELVARLADGQLGLDGERAKAEGRTHGEPQRLPLIRASRLFGPLRLNPKRARCGPKLRRTRELLRCRCTRLSRRFGRHHRRPRSFPLRREAKLCPPLAPRKATPSAGRPPLHRITSQTASPPPSLRTPPSRQAPQQPAPRHS
jgi:hypothetical protein